MARKKAGSRAAAGQAKARERARRKARIAGPSLAQAAYVPPVDEASEAEPEDATVMEAVQAAPSPAPAPEAPAPRAAAPAARARAAVSSAPRRERPLTGMTPTGSLKRELALIGSITLVIAAALAALAVTNTLGA
ncbi:MAG: hypothetical protein OXE50_01025 [Chloroflexi bacterium]|nr:hypothetical protein [Chloroflexota bacterium]